MLCKPTNWQTSKPFHPPGMVNTMSTISSAFKGGASLTCCSPILHQPSRKELNVCKFLSSHCLEGWWIMKIYTHKFWLYWQRMTGKQYLWTAWWEHEQTQWWAARALLWPVERHRLWYTGMILPRGCPCWSSCMCLCKIMARPAITGKCGRLKRWNFFLPKQLFKRLSLFQDVTEVHLKKADFF